MRLLVTISLLQLAAGEAPATYLSAATPELLSVYWSSSAEDNYVVGTAAGRADAARLHYGLDSNSDGATLPKSGSSVALSSYFSAAAKDHLLTSNATYAKAHGYALQRVEGFAASQSGGPTFVQGSMMFSAARKDHVLCFTAWQKAFFAKNGYAEVWREGWLDSSNFPPSPPPPGPPGPPPAPQSPHVQCVAENVHKWEAWPSSPTFANCPFQQVKNV